MSKLSVPFGVCVQRPNTCMCECHRTLPTELCKLIDRDSIQPPLNVGAVMATVFQTMPTLNPGAFNFIHLSIGLFLILPSSSV